MKRKSCGTCRHSRPDWTNPENPELYCSNIESEGYGYNIMLITGCGEWEGKVCKRYCPLSEK